MFFNRFSIGIFVILFIFTVFMLGNLYVLNMEFPVALSRALYGIIPVSIGVSFGVAYQHYIKHKKNTEDNSPPKT